MGIDPRKLSPKRAFLERFLFTTTVNHKTLATLNCIRCGPVAILINNLPKNVTGEDPAIAILSFLCVHCCFVVTEEERGLLPYVATALV